MLYFFGKEQKMNKKNTTIMIFIFIIIVMFFLFPKSCNKSLGNPGEIAYQTAKG
jgi:hypothetical protein